MSSSPSRGWRLHGDGRSIAPGEVVAPGERLTWPRTIGIGVQHVVAMFGATFLVPLLTGFDPATTLFFTGVGTLLFLGITSGRLPSYLGSSFALLAPIGAVTGYTRDSGAPLDPHRAALAQGGIISVGLCLLVVGVIVHLVGSAWIDRLMPPIVTGAIVSLIGFNLAPSAWNNVKQAPVTAVVTIVSILVITVMFKGIIGRLAILIGVLIGYATAVLRGEVNFDAVAKAPVLGLPDFQAPAFDVRYLGLFIPVVLVLIAENIGHVKSVSAMTGEDLDDVTGRGRGGMGVDVPDPPGIKVRPLQCQAQSAFLLRARRLGARHIEGVGGDGRAGGDRGTGEDCGGLRSRGRRGPGGDRCLFVVHLFAHLAGL